MKLVQNYLLIIILLLLATNTWAEAIGDKDGYLKPVSNTQLEKLLKERLIKQIKVVDSRPYRAGFSQQMVSQQYVEPAVAMLAPSYSSQNEPVVAAAKSAGASSTNVQERGVDELDLIKTDGRFLYAVNNNGNSYYGFKSKSSGIRIYDTKTTSIQPRQIGSIGFGKGIFISGMYLLTKKHQLLLIGNSYNKKYVLRKNNNYGGNLTHIMRINIKNKHKPKIIQYIKIEGWSKTTRRIKNKLYLVLPSNNFSPNTYKYVQTKKPISKEKRAKYKREITNKIKQWKVDSILPRYQVLGKTGVKVLTKSGQFLLNSEENTHYSVTTLLAIDLNASDFKFDTLNYFGYSNTIYVSPKAMYVTNNQYRGLKNLNAQRFPKKLSHLIIHKFSFKGKGFDYRGSGVVLGHLWGGGLNSFKLDEDRRGNLRIVTSNNNWKKTHYSDPAANSPVVLTALAENPRNKQLITLSRLPNHKYPKALGKQGERLYGARLFNDYAYFVTFQNTDPLYVVDMRNPYNMRVTGKLIIPGFSDYLHPISKNLLLGVGKEAKEQKGKGWALFQGLKLSLFDISNPNLPREVHKIEIGKRGTSSPVNRNHHAFTSLVMPNSPITRIALPINLVTKKNDYQNSEQGLHQFDVNTKTQKIVPVGKLIPPRKKKQYWSWNESDRSIIINDKLYYYSDGRFWGGKWR